jgi:anti-sigma factor RsiW
MSIWSRVMYALGCSPLARTRCRWAAGLLQPYLDGQLDAHTARDVEQHLQYCRQCGQEAAVYSQLKESLARDGAVSPESVAKMEAFADRLMRSDDENR